MKLEPNAPDLAEFVKSLIDEIGRLEEENHRLRLAMALRAWKPSPKRRGRPVKYSIEEDIRLLAMVEKLQKRMSIKTRMGVLRWFMEKKREQTS